MKTRSNHLVGTITSVCLFFVLMTVPGTFVRADETSKDPVVVAQWLAGNRYQGWSYGGNAAEEQIDCVQFVLALIEELEDRTLGAEARAAILISGVDGEELRKDNYKIVRERDPRITGVQKALVDLERGVVVSIGEARDGDFVQYWMKKNDGTWFGHAGVLTKVEKDEQGVVRATIFGAHAGGSQSDQACGASKFRLRLVEAEDRRIFIVRYQPETE